MIILIVYVPLSLVVIHGKYCKSELTLIILFFHTKYKRLN